MENTLLMAVDLGTSFIKIAIYDTLSRCIASKSVPVQSDTPSPGLFIQKGEDIFLSMANCMKYVAQQLDDKAQDVAAIAFTGQMAGFIGVDKDWNDITTWSCSLDNRYMPYARRQITALKDDFYKISGTNVPQMAPKYEWFKTEFPVEAVKIVKCMVISSYVIGKLGDLPIEKASIDKSYTQWTGLADVKRGEWSKELCDAVEMKPDHLPEIVGSNHVCGCLSAKMADIVGLKPGIPLVSGAGDKIAGCLGAAVVNPGEMIMEASSFGALSCCVDEYKLDMKTRRMDIVPSSLPGYFFALHFIPGSGISLDWFINVFGDGGKEDKDALFLNMESAVGQIQPGCDGLMAIGLLAGMAQPLDGALRGMWMGFDLSHKKEHFYRALLESYSYDFALTARSLQSIYPAYRMDNIKIIGGGAKSAVWTQMNADVMGKTYKHLDRSDVALWGAAIMAGNAIGVFQDMAATAVKHVNVNKQVHPVAERTKEYLQHVDLYERYTVELHDYFEGIQNVKKK